jgi:hypothetical protein
MVDHHGIRLTRFVDMSDEQGFDRHALYLRAIRFQVESIPDLALVAVMLELVERDRVPDDGQASNMKFNDTAPVLTPAGGAPVWLTRLAELALEQLSKRDNPASCSRRSTNSSMLAKNGAVTSTASARLRASILPSTAMR